LSLLYLGFTKPVLLAAVPLGDLTSVITLDEVLLMFSLLIDYAPFFWSFSFYASFFILN
jgi:hypothetical protein